MLSSYKLKWGILGTSFISEVMAKAINDSENAELAAIGSRDKAKAASFAKKYNIPHSYSEYQHLLDDDSIDIVYIGLPNHLHKEWIIQCAKAGKHILCEKPLVLSFSEAEEAFSVVKQHNVFCMEALMYHCHPFTMQLKSLINEGTIGKIKHINAFYSANIAELANKSAGGAIRNLGCYPLSLIRLLVENEPHSIESIGQLNNDKTQDHLGITYLKFKNDTTATITTADHIDMLSQLTVFGSEGMIEINTNPWLPGEANQITIKRGDKEEVRNFNADKSLYTYQIDTVCEQIARDLKNPETPGVSWEHSLGNVSVLEKWLKQIKN